MANNVRIARHRPRTIAPPTSSQKELDVKAMIAAAVQKEVKKGPDHVGTHSSACLSPATQNLLEKHAKDETLLKVTIVCPQESTNFYVPVSLLVDRELEMQKSASYFGIGPTRWIKSRLFSEWQHCLESGDFSISLNPQEDCASTNQSHFLEWAPWLTTCIRAYYNTGTVRIPDDCMGSDILLALEYFGILYSPEQLVFDSFGSYLRVKMWSDYFTHRARMADWVVQRLLTTPSRHSHSYVTCPNTSEQACFPNSNTPLDILDGDLVLDPTRYGSTPSRAVVYEFFNNDDPEEDSVEEEEKLDGLMRNDFCAFLQASLPGTHVTFCIKQVSLKSTQETVQRAVLRINCVLSSNTSKNSSSTTSPDEVTSSAMPTDTAAPTLYRAQTPTPTIKALAPQVADIMTATKPLTPSTPGDLSVDKPRRNIQASDIFRRRARSDVSSARGALVHSNNLLEDPDPPTVVTPDGPPPQEKEPKWSPRKLPFEQQDAPIPRDESLLARGRRAAFVRSLSEKIIRQTIADMDTIDHGLVLQDSGNLHTSSRPSSTTPSDEARHYRFDKNGLFLPPLDLDAPQAGVISQPPAYRRHLEVIDDCYKPNTAAGAETSEAPLEHVNVNANKPCDGSVLSALSSPWDGDSSKKGSSPARASPARVSPARVSPAASRGATVASPVSLHRQPSLDNLSEFRTTVDAFSIADEDSVQIALPEDEEQQVTEEEEEEVVEQEGFEARFSFGDNDTQDFQPACVGIFYATLCGPVSESPKPKKAVRPRKGSKTDFSSQTSKTDAETEEDDSRELRPPRVAARKKAAPEDPIVMLGEAAENFFTGVADNLRSIMASDGSTVATDPTRTTAATYHIRPQNHAKWNDFVVVSPGKEEEEQQQDEDDDDVDEILSRLSDKVANKKTQRPYLPPRPVSQKKPPPGAHRPGAHRRTRPTTKLPATADVSLARVQDIIKDPSSGHHAVSRRRKNVMRNLELLKDVDESTPQGRRSAMMRRRTMDYRTAAEAREHEKKRAGHRKGLLGIFRKK